MPAYVLVLLYSFMALSFPDRWNYLLGLLLALVLYLGIWRLGRIISSSFIKLKDETIFFPLGLGIFLLITYFAAVFSTGVVMYFFWIAAAILAIFEIKILFKPLSRHFIWAMPFLLLGFWSTLTPSVFFDALVYHLGLPMQFSISGRMETLPFHFFSTFPPFEFVLNLLLVKLNALSGIKVFSILIIFHIAYALIDLTESLMKDEGASQFRSEFVVLPVFFLASLWIQVHLITADLLVAMFLVCSICSMVKNRVAMDYRHLLLIAFLAAFAGWTKPTALPYIALMILLWFPLRFVQWNPKKIVFFYMVILILLSPLFLRNYLITGDPLYPTLSKNSPNWSDKQQLALAADISAPKINPLSRLFKVPIEIIYAPYKYGSAAEVGILYAVSLIVYLFFWKSHPITNRLLIFLFLCYVFWIFVFRDFRQFFPVFLLIHIPCAIALSDLFIQKKWVSVIILLASAFFSVHLILPVFRNHMLVISIKQNQRKYLERNLDYYPFAIWTEFVQTNGKILMLGESRTAYLHLPVLTSTPFDRHPFFFWLSRATTYKDLQKKFVESKIEYMMVNWREYARFAEKCGILPIDPVPPRFRDVFSKGKARTGVPLAHLKPNELQILSEFSRQCLKPQWRMGDQYLVWHVKCEQ